MHILQFILVERDRRLVGFSRNAGLPRFSMCTGIPYRSQMMFSRVRCEDRVTTHYATRSRNHAATL